MKLIGISGLKGSGKNTVADFIQEFAEKDGLLVVQRGFADYVKWAAARIFWPDISMEDALRWTNEVKNDERAYIEIHDRTNNGYGISGRQLLQHMGTEVGRELFGESFWIDLFLPREAWREKFFITDKGFPHIILVTDVRFPNEASRIKYLGGEIWDIEREGIKSIDTHVSELKLPRNRITHTLYNKGTLDELKTQVHYLYSELSL